MNSAACLLFLIQILVGVLVWVLGPWPLLACIGGVVGLVATTLVLDDLSRGMSRSAGMGAVILSQVPALVCSWWTLAILFTWLPEMDIPIFAIQALLQRWTPWIALLSPEGTWRDAGLYLVVTALVPSTATAVAVAFTWWRAGRAGSA